MVRGILLREQIFRFRVEYGWGGYCRGSKYIDTGLNMDRWDILEGVDI